MQNRTLNSVYLKSEISQSKNYTRQNYIRKEDFIQGYDNQIERPECSLSSTPLRQKVRDFFRAGM